MTQQKLLHWMPPLLIALITAAIWGHTVRFEFVWDDGNLIQRVESIRSFRNIPEMFTSLEAQSAWPEGFTLFRPVRLLVCAALVWLGGEPEPQAWIFHLANVMGHGLAAMLLFAVAARLFGFWFPDSSATRTRLVALWTAAAYAAHPVVSEVVCWAKALDDELATIFILAASLRLLKRGGNPPVAGALVLFTLAIYSKISAVPFAFVATILLRHVQGLSWRATAARVWPFFLVTLLFMTHRYVVIGRSSQTAPISGTYVQTLIDMFPVVPEYLRLLCGIPPFRIDYSYQQGGNSFFSLPVLAGVGLLIAVVILSLNCRRDCRRRYVLFGLLWIGLFLLPVSNLLPMMQYMAERFLYLPMIGWLLILGGVLHGIRRVPVGVTTGVILILAWSLLAHDRSFIWRDNVTLFVQSSRQAPRVPRVEENAVGAIFLQPQVRATFRFANSQRDLHVQEVPGPAARPPLRQTLEAAFALFPDDPTVARALGLVEEWDGNFERAQQLFQISGRRSRQLQPLTPGLPKPSARPDTPP